MDSGRVVGAECSQYLANHTRRTDIVPTVDVLQAREMVSGRLSVRSERLCVIPQDEDETLCWGFECTDGAADYWVFVNAKTRETEQILRVITTNQGGSRLIKDSPPRREENLDRNRRNTDGGRDACG